MGSVAHFTDLRSGVVDALHLLAESTAGQSVIRVGAEACEVEWDPGARYHPALLLPLVLLTAAIDEGAARARWQGVGFAQALGVAHRLDTIETGMLLALAGRDGAVDFAAELPAGSTASAWTARRWRWTAAASTGATNTGSARYGRCATCPAS